jgi:hypothetical protein
MRGSSPVSQKHLRFMSSALGMRLFNRPDSIGRSIILVEGRWALNPMYRLRGSSNATQSLSSGFSRSVGRMQVADFNVEAKDPEPLRNRKQNNHRGVERTLSQTVPKFHRINITELGNFWEPKVAQYLMFVLCARIVLPPAYVPWPAHLCPSLPTCGVLTPVVRVVFWAD